MQPLVRHIETLLAAPAGRAFLLIAARSGLGPEVITEPRVSLEIAAFALDEVSRWRMDRAIVLAELKCADSGKLEDLARALLACRGAKWWFVPLQRSSQVWLSSDECPPLTERLVTPSGLPSSWERYAQKPAGGFYTSTLIDGTSSAGAVLAVGTSDFSDQFQSGSISAWRLDVAPDACVFEIDGPQTWHALCVQYAAHGQDDRIVPDWSAVVRDFDAVHLTLGGLLTAEQVRIESSAGWSSHDGWDFEQTLWLKWKFTKAERLPDLQLRSESPLGLSVRSGAHLRR